MAALAWRRAVADDARLENTWGRRGARPEARGGVRVSLSLFFFTIGWSLFWFRFRASFGEEQVLGLDPFTIHNLNCVMGLQFGFQLLELGLV